MTVARLTMQYDEAEAFGPYVQATVRGRLRRTLSHFGLDHPSRHIDVIWAHTDPDRPGSPESIRYVWVTAETSLDG